GPGIRRGRGSAAGLDPATSAPRQDATEERDRNRVMTTRTYTPRLSDIERRWFVVDAKGQTLGRLATQVAVLLAGKHKPEYATHLDTGDHVIVINASSITVNGDKLAAKVYARHSGYPGGFRQETLGDLLARRPE